MNDLHIEILDFIRPNHLTEAQVSFHCTKSKFGLLMVGFCSIDRSGLK